MDKVYKANWRLQKWLDMDAEEHGTRKGYYYGCRCPECKNANTLYTRAYRMVRSGKTTWEKLRETFKGELPWE